MAAITTALAGMYLALSPPAFARSADSAHTADRAGLARGAATVPSFARDAAEMAKMFPDATIDAATGGCLVVAPTDSAAPAPTIDPRFNTRLTRADYVFAPRKIGTVGGWFRIATIHYVTDPDMTDQARRTACLIGRLWSLYKTHFGREIEFPFQADETNVYLLPQVPASKKGEGGETGNNQIDVFGCGVAKRTSLEWVRTIAHEWGHLTVYAARGYTEPESEAAGYLGERLFIKWMREAQAARPADAPDDGTTTADLDLYYRRQIEPLMERFQQGGPGSESMDGENTEAMDYYIASVLATDAALGSATVGIALRNAESERPREFLIALRKYLYDKSDLTIQSPAWVPLREGDYRVTASAAAAAVGASASAASAAPTTLNVTTPAWSQFSDHGALRIQRIEPPRPARPPRS